MNESFRVMVERLHPKCEALLAMEPVTIATAKDTPNGGVYLFSRGTEHLYVGRTKRNILVRLKNHVSTADDCPFAWHLAREATNNQERSYTKTGSRKALLQDPTFSAAYKRAKSDIRTMHVRYVQETDPTTQALLEIYVAVSTNAKYNDFGTS